MGVGQQDGGRPRVAVVVPVHDQESGCRRPCSPCGRRPWPTGSASSSTTARPATSPPRSATPWTTRDCAWSDCPTTRASARRSTAASRSRRRRTSPTCPPTTSFLADHLETLVAALERAPAAPLAVAGVRHDQTRTSPGRIDGEPLQLVQVAAPAHRTTGGSSAPSSRPTTSTGCCGAACCARGEPVGTGRVSCDLDGAPEAAAPGAARAVGRAEHLPRALPGAGAPAAAEHAWATCTTRSSTTAASASGRPCRAPRTG